ncbi:hypothetical protein HM1_2496 [Heliomicrobium modesticaldum Ice1]|uniref:Uncharacterized protein n=1 Tax=Heliobacterium modesticaldum (strain ATCC 51547 / Ice1) TaxID=498761 RepID=B0TAJ4_HELMI|nr:hypothetical protein HM1_2496 [Heliomicrobium modesticaldum Ice1]
MNSPLTLVPILLHVYGREGRTMNDKNACPEKFFRTGIDHLGSLV